MWEHRDNALVPSLVGKNKERLLHVCLLRILISLSWMSRRQGMDAGTKDEFYELMHHSAHHHGKAVLMITHDPEEVKDYADRNIHLVRDQDSPWRCFNVHESDQEVEHA